MHGTMRLKHGMNKLVVRFWNLAELVLFGDCVIIDMTTRSSLHRSLIGIRPRWREDLVESSEYVPQPMNSHCIIFPHYTFLWPEDGPHWPKHVVSLIKHIQRRLCFDVPTPSSYVFIYAINQKMFYSDMCNLNGTGGFKNVSWFKDSHVCISG